MLAQTAAAQFLIKISLAFLNQELATEKGCKASLPTFRADSALLRGASSGLSKTAPSTL